MGELVGAIKGISRSLPRPRLPGRLRQCVALQRDQRHGDPADAGDRRRRSAPRRRRVRDHRLQGRGRGDPPRRRARRPGAPISASRSISARSSAARTARRRRSTSPHEKRVGDFVRALIRDGVVTAVHDLSDGGLAVAPRRNGDRLGNRRDGDRSSTMQAPLPVFFGEDQGRYVVTAPPRRRRRHPRPRRCGRRLRPLDRQYRRNALNLGLVASISVAELRKPMRVGFRLHGRAGL